MAKPLETLGLFSNILAAPPPNPRPVLEFGQWEERRAPKKFIPEVKPNPT